MLDFYGVGIKAAEIRGLVDRMATLARLVEELRDPVNQFELPQARSPRPLGNHVSRALVTGTHTEGFASARPAECRPVWPRPCISPGAGGCDIALLRGNLHRGPARLPIMTYADRLRCRRCPSGAVCSGGARGTTRCCSSAPTCTASAAGTCARWSLWPHAVEMKRQHCDIR